MRYIVISTPEEGMQLAEKKDGCTYYKAITVLRSHLTIKNCVEIADKLNDLEPTEEKKDESDS